MITSRGVKFFDTPEKIKRSTPKNPPEESVFKPIEVPNNKSDSKKLRIFENKNLSTTIDKEIYTLSNINDLVKKNRAQKYQQKWGL